MRSKLHRWIDTARSQGLQGQLLRGLAGTGAIRLINAPLMIALGILLARALGPADYGLYSYATSLVLLLATPARLGLPALLVREIAKYDLQQNWGPLRGLLRRSNQFVFVLSFALASGAGIFAWRRTDRTEGDLNTLLIAFALIPLLALSDLRGATLRGLRQVVRAQLPEMVLRPVIILGGCSALAAVGSLTVERAMGIQVGSALAAFLLGAAMLARSLPREVANTPPVFETRSWLSALLPLSFLSGMHIISNQADLVIVGALLGNAHAGLYRVAIQGASIVALVLASIGIVVGPQISRLHTAGDRARLQRMLTWSTRLVMAVAVPIAMTLIAFGPQIIDLMFGHEYADAYLCMCILVLGQLANAATGVIGLVLNMSGHEGSTARAMAISAVTNVTLNLALIPTIGIEGAACASAISMALWNLILYRNARALVGLQAGLWGAEPKG